MSSTSAQRLANLMKRIYDEGRVTHHEGESQDAYYKRLRDKAIQVQRYDRRQKRKAAHAARKRNR